MNRKKGFTLIELLVVIVIIGVLASVVGPRLLGRADQGKIASAKATIENMSMALDSFQLDVGRYPTSEQGLNALIEEPGNLPASATWRGPYLKAREIPLDPWGAPYQYVYPGKANPKWYDILSFGKDSREGGSGDDADIGNI